MVAIKGPLCVTVRIDGLANGPVESRFEGNLQAVAELMIEVARTIRAVENASLGPAPPVYAPRSI